MTPDLTPAYEQAIRDAVARGEAAQDNREFHWHVARDLLAEVDRLRAAATKAAVKLERRAADRATIDRLRAAHERLRWVCRAILPRLHEEEAGALGSALGEAPASEPADSPARSSAVVDRVGPTDHRQVARALRVTGGDVERAVDLLFLARLPW